MFNPLEHNYHPLGPSESITVLIALIQFSSIHWLNNLTQPRPTLNIYLNSN